ncbi:MAG TPA: YceI family protein [Candidatus Kapabacteria bacterium]|nr:YceI family protein [Candidatus Kapabacteria bacterium]
MFIICSSALFAQQNTPAEYKILPESHLWLVGSATTGSWTCGTAYISGYGIPSTSVRPAEVAVSIKVKDLDCGNKFMNNDMYDAMNSDQFPTIQYHLISARRLSSQDGDSVWTKLQTIGTLDLNGVSKQLNIQVNIRRLANNKIQVVGSVGMLMSDFNVTPPSALFGLIKASNDLEVRFDITAGPGDSLTSKSQ